jgi:sulfate transport system substrate-binding protein
MILLLFAFLISIVFPVFLTAKEDSTTEILNVSYDPTREFYEEYNKIFAAYWKQKTGGVLTVNQSHGGSSKQARSVIDGLEADVVTLALSVDIDAIANQSDLIAKNWQKRLPNNSSPYLSTIVMLVRKGNPKGIKDWDDLVKPGVEVITANPKTSGAARLAYLAAWGYILKKELGDLSKINNPKYAKEVAAATEKARAFVTELYKHVPVLDSGARGSTITFVQRGIGDVLLAWENEAYLSIYKLGPNEFEIIMPSISVLAEPTVSVVDKVVEKHKTKEVAQAYLEYLYSQAGQELAAKYYYRPSRKDLVSKKDLLKSFKEVELFTVDDVFGGWPKAQKEHFEDGGTFDQMYNPSK